MRKFSALLLMLVLLVVISACDSNTNNKKEGNDNNQSKEDGGTLVVATKLEPSEYVINYNWDGAIPYINRNIFSKLVAYDDNSGEIFGDLAEEWDVSDDLKSYTFHLRKNVTWHDGEPFTSEDVKWTIDSILEQGDAANGYRSLANVESVEVSDEHTVVIHLSSETGVLVEKLADYQGFDILPKHIYEGTDVMDNPANKKPIGTGPFKFDSHEIGSHTTLVANSDYYGDGPYLDKVIFQFTPAEETALTALEAGEIGTMTASPAFAEISRLESLENVSVDMQPSTITQWIGFNMDNTREHISDPVVREAIAHAIDNTEIGEKLYLGLVTPAESWYTSKIEWADNESVRIPERNIEYANQLLDDAGYERGKDGYRFSLVYRAFETSIFGTTDIPNFIKQQLDDIGINIDYERYEWALRTEMLDQRRDWDISAGGGDRGPDPLNFASFLMSNTATNKMLYSNEELDDLFKQGEKYVEQEERAVIYNEIQEIIAEDLPMYNVVEYAIPRAYSPKFTGFFWQEDAINSTNHMFNSVKKVN